MERLIAQINPTTKIIYDKGRFDDWCVYLMEKGKRTAPRDIDCFIQIQKLSKKYSNAQLYKLFLIIYRHTYSSIDLKVIEIIKNIAGSFQAEDEIVIQKWFTIMYASMIAENQKENTKLGKRIKHLGIYQLLIENLSPENAANFSKGKSRKELDAIMKIKGI